MNISKEAIEAAARVAFPSAWEESEWRNAWHAESYRAHMKWARKRALDQARAALEAAAPLLMAQAWDEGELDGYENAKFEEWPPLEPNKNPYRKETP